MPYLCRLARGIVALPLLGVLSGCAQNPGAGQATGTITLRVADWGGAASDPASSRYEREVRAEWNRLHPDIRIAEEHIPGSDAYVSKMLTAFVARTEPDIMALDASSAAFIDNDTLRDLTPFAQADRLDLTVYYPNVLNLARRGPHLYALPADFTPMMLYYNKRLFAQAGIPTPHDGWTWDEFHADCRRLTVCIRRTTARYWRWTRLPSPGFSGTPSSWRPAWCWANWRSARSQATASRDCSFGAGKRSSSCSWRP